MNATETLPRPWFQEFWVWFFLAILGMGVASGTGVLVIGINNAPQMVTGDYQPLGKVLVNTSERADRARALGLSGALEITQRRAEVQLQASDTPALPEKLLIRFQHPTNAERDVSALATRVEAGHWTASLGELPIPERARVIVSDLQQSWWLAGRFDAQADGRIGLEVEQL